MDRKTKYLWFREIENPGRKTRRVQVISLSQRMPLADIHWYGAWRQYVFDPQPDTTWNNGCLLDVLSVLDELRAEQRRKTPSAGRLAI